MTPTYERSGARLQNALPQGYWLVSESFLGSQAELQDNASPAEPSQQ